MGGVQFQGFGSSSRVSIVITPTRMETAGLIRLNLTLEIVATYSKPRSDKPFRVAV